MSFALLMRFLFFFVEQLSQMITSFGWLFSRPCDFLPTSFPDHDAWFSTVLDRIVFPILSRTCVFVQPVPSFTIFYCIFYVFFFRAPSPGLSNFTLFSFF